MCGLVLKLRWSMVFNLGLKSHHNADMVERGATNHLGRHAYGSPEHSAHFQARPVKENQVAGVQA